MTQHHPAPDDATPGPQQKTSPELGQRAAAIFALVAHRLDAFYNHAHLITEAQASTLCQEWLMRAQMSLPAGERKQLAQLSFDLAEQIRSSLSREAGLYTAHELMEALDPRYASELGASIMDECVRLLKTQAAD